MLIMTPAPPWRYFPQDEACMDGGLRESHAWQQSCRWWGGQCRGCQQSQRNEGDNASKTMGDNAIVTRAMTPVQQGPWCLHDEGNGARRCWCNAGNDATRQTWCCSFSASTERGPSTTAQPPRLTVATREGSASPRHAVAVERQMLWRRLSSTGLWIVEFEAWHEINHNQDQWVTQTRLLRTSFLWVTFQ